jgi:hypothetical protein
MVLLRIAGIPKESRTRTMWTAAPESAREGKP